MATWLFVEETLTASLTSSPAPVSRRCHIWTGRYHAGTQWLSIRISADPLEQLCNHSPSTSLSTTLSRQAYSPCQFSSRHCLPYLRRRSTTV